MIILQINTCLHIGCTGMVAESCGREVLKEGWGSYIAYSRNFISQLPPYIDHKYKQYIYPIQDSNTRTMIKDLKSALAPSGFYYTGRFADWEYYNMDVAMGAAMDLSVKF